MRNIIVLGPGKTGTTYLGSRITNSLVVHDIGRSRFKFIVFIKQLLFFSRLILFKNLVILPYINDSKREMLCYVDSILHSFPVKLIMGKNMEKHKNLMSNL